MFKTCIGSKEMQTIQTWKLQNLHRLKKCKHAKPRCNVRGQGLIGLDFCIFLYFFEPVQVLRLPGLVFLHLIEPVQVLEPWVLKTCTGSTNATNPNLKAPFFCFFWSLCRFWSLGCLKPAQAQTNAKANPNLEAPKPAQAQTNATNANLEAPKPAQAPNKCKTCKTQMQCQRSGLDWSGFLYFLPFFEPVQVLELPGLDFLHFFEPVQVLEPASPRHWAWTSSAFRAVSREISLASDIIATRKMRYFE